MNEDILKGKWKELSGSIKAQWGKLTDDDLTRIEGDKTRLVGILQQKYGYTKDEAEKEYDEFISKKRAA